MTDGLDSTSLDALLSEDSPTVSLQAEIDRQSTRIRDLEQRVRRLESDRAQLRQRLAAQRRRPLLRRRLHGEPATPTSTGTTGKPRSSKPFDEFPIPEALPPGNMPTIGVVLDEFSRVAWSYEAPLIHLTPSNWRDQIDSHPIGLILVESAWSGPEGTWSRRIARFGDPDAELVALTSEARRRGISTVFWNKEDPANFAWFAGAAALFDWVFTVDGDTIPSYRDRLGHNRVDVLPFAAQPAIHHQVPDIRRDLDIAFAGSYYAKKHAERRRQMEFLLPAAIPYGLDIWDRHAGTHDDRFLYPDHLATAVRGSLTYAETLTANHRYKIFLNVNSTSTSPTMCARRVFELLASGTPIVSGPSLAVERWFGDQVSVVRSQGEAGEAIRSMLEDSGVAASRSAAGVAAIADGGHTYAERLKVVLAATGLR